MVKRKFSPKRLYKLAENLIKSVSMILLLFGIVSLTIFYKNGGNMLEERSEMCNELYSYETIEDKEVRTLIQEENIDCYIRALENYRNWEKNAFLSTGVGVGLLVVFYGGTRLYKYLFPEVKRKIKNE